MFYSYESVQISTESQQRSFWPFKFFESMWKPNEALSFIQAYKKHTRFFPNLIFSDLRTTVREL